MVVAAQVAQRNENDLIACSVLLPVISFGIAFTKQPCHKKLPFKLNGISHCYQLDLSICVLRVVGW